MEAERGKRRPFPAFLGHLKFPSQTPSNRDGRPSCQTYTFTKFSSLSVPHKTTPSQRRSIEQERSNANLQHRTTAVVSVLLLIGFFLCYFVFFFFGSFPFEFF